MIDQFLRWAEIAPVPSRADGVSALARALLYSTLDPAATQAAIVTLAGFLDDPAPEVRRALADAFASAIDAPHGIVVALAEDEPSIAAIVLSRSPVLLENDLAVFAPAAPSLCQAAIASRPGLPARISEILAETASAEALVVLAANLDANLPAGAIARMIERHGAHARLREVLLARGDLPAPLHFELVAEDARVSALAVLSEGRNTDANAARAVRDAVEKTAVALASGRERAMGAADLAALAAHLRRSGRLTPAFVMRVLLSGNRDFFDAILSELGAMPLARASGFVESCRSNGFAALYRKAGLPPFLLPAFQIMLEALHDWNIGTQDHMVYPLVMDVHDQCAAINDGRLDGLLSTLRRFEIEAARAEANRPKYAALSAPNDMEAAGGAWLEDGFASQAEASAGIVYPGAWADWDHDAAPAGDTSLTELLQENGEAGFAIVAVADDDAFADAAMAYAPVSGPEGPAEQIEPHAGAWADAQSYGAFDRVDHEETAVEPPSPVATVFTGAYANFPFRVVKPAYVYEARRRGPVIDVEASMAAFEAELFAA